MGLFVWMNLLTVLCILAILPIPSNSECVDVFKNCHLISSTSCKSIALQNVMKRKCAKTCGFCQGNKIPGPKPTEPFKNKPLPKPKPTKPSKKDPSPKNSHCKDTNPNCKNIIPSCKSEFLHKTMVDQCAKTCGFCQEKNPGPNPTKPSKPKNSNKKCEDKIKNCVDVEDLCNDEDVGDEMLENCARTCDRCDELENYDPKNSDNSYGDCVDLNPNCEEAKDQCKNEAMQDLMREECPKTCGFCGKKPTEPSKPKPTEPSKNRPTPLKPQPKPHKNDPNCVDANPNCHELLDLCKDKEGSIFNIMKQQCKKTCRFCQGNGPKNSGENSDNSGGCEDVNPNCDEVNEMCYEKEGPVLDIMKRQCAKTCEFCQDDGNPQTFWRPKPTEPSKNFDGKCVDTNKDCKQIKHLCEIPAMFDVMEEECKKTCGKCEKSKNSEPPKPKNNKDSGKCIDTNANCKDIKDLCKSATLSDTLKKQCAKTCGFC